MTKFSKLLRSLLALVLVLASILPFGTYVMAAQDDSGVEFISGEDAQEVIDNADYVIDANELINISELDPQSREDELEKKYEELANVMLYGEQTLEEEKPKTKATNFVDYVFLNFEVGDPSRSFNWQTRTTTSESRGYFSDTYMGAYACYYKGTDPSLFMPIETSGDGLKRLGGKYTIREGDIAEVRIIDIPNNTTNKANGFDTNKTTTFKSYFSVRSSADATQYGTGKTSSTLKYTFGGQTVTFDIDGSHHNKILYGVRWDPIQHTTSGETLFGKEDGVLIYVDHIYVGPKDKRPVKVTFKNTAGDELITRWVGYGQNAYHWWHNKSLTIDPNAATHTIWGWEVYQDGVNTKRFVTDPTTIVCEKDTEFRLKSVTIPNLDLNSTQRKDNGTSTEDDKYVLSVDGFDTAQITAGGYGKPIDFAILMDRSGSMGEFVGTPKEFSNTKATAHTEIEAHLKTLDKTKWEGYYRVSGWSQCKSAHDDRTDPANYFYTMPLRYNRYRTDGKLAANSSDDVANWEVLYLDDTCICNALDGKTYSAGDNMSKYGIYNFIAPEKGGKGLGYCPHVKWMSVTDAYDLFIQYRENTDGTYAKDVNFTTKFKIGVSRLGKQQEAVEKLLQKIYLSNVNFQTKTNDYVNTVSIVGYGHSVFLEGYPFFDSDGDVEAKADYQFCHNIGCTKYSTPVTHANYEAILKAVRNSYCFGQTRIDGAVRLLAGKQSYMQIAAGQAATKFDKTKFLPAVKTGRHRVVIAITDGMPTWTNSDFSHKTAGSAIDGASALKNASTSIYTIGISSKLTNITAVSTGYYGNMTNYNTQTNQWRNASNFMLLLSSAYGTATWYPRTADEHHKTSVKYDSSVHKYDANSRVTSPKYYYNDVDNADGLTGFLDNIWKDTAPKLEANTVKGGLGSLWLYEEFGREWKLDTTPGAKINIYAEPYDDKGTYGTKILIGSHPITEEVKSAMRDGEGTETQVKVLIDPTQTQTMSNPGYTLTIAPTTDQGFTATLKWSDAKKSYIRNTAIDIGHVAVNQETGKTLTANYGYRVVMEIPVEVNRENTIGGNNIPLTKTTSGFFKANSAADTGKGELINGYEPPNANVSYEITGEEFDYFMTMEEYVKAHSKDSATIENIYNSLVTFPEDPEAENGIKLVNAQNRSRVDYVRVDYTISTEDNALVYQKSAAARSLDYTVPTDKRTTMLSALEKDTSFNAAATITPTNNATDSFGRAPYAPAVAELNPNLYVPKFVVVDFDAQASVDLQKEAEIIDLNAENTGKNGAFTVTGSGASAKGQVDYNFRKTHSNTTEQKSMLETIETIPYTVNAKNPTKNGETVIDRQVYILPGNVISYDDTLFGFWEDGALDTTATVPTAGKWVRMGTYGNDQQLPENSQVHGYDEKFATTGDYHGASTVARVSAGTPDVAPIVFEFFGTGFELLSRTAPDSGTVIVEIFKAKEDGTYGDVADKGYLVDTYLASKTLYQIPIVQFLSGKTTPAKYKVHVIPVYDMIFDHGKKGFTPITEEQARAIAGFDETVDFTFVPSVSVAPATRGTYEPAGAYNVYVDGCRVYNTLTEDTQGIRDFVYSLAGEQDANILNINDQIVDVTAKVDWTNSTEISGMLFIEAPQADDSNVEGDTGSDETITNTTHGYCLGMNGSLYEEEDPNDSNKFYVRHYETVDGVSTLVRTKHGEYNTDIYYRLSPKKRTMFYCTDNTGAEVPLTETEVREYVGNGEEIVYYSAAYKVIGPANEVYLSSGQGVAFKVNANSAKVFMSMKTVDGTAVSVQAYNGTGFENITALEGYCSDTEMYFDLTDYVKDGMVMIKNAGSGILSLCNLKTASAEGSLEPIIDLTAVRKALKAFSKDAELPQVDENVVIRHSLNLQSDISVNLMVPAMTLEGYDSYTMECTVAGKTFYPEAVEKDGFVYFIVDGLMATQMNENIHSVLHLMKGDEEYVSMEDDYSIACYAYTVLNKEEAAQSIKTLCANLLRYGSLAQVFKGYQTDALADEEMTEIHKSYLTDMDTVAFGSNNRLLGDVTDPTVTWFGKSMILDSKVTMVYVLNVNGYAGAPEDLRLRVSYEDINGRTVELELDDIRVYNEEAGLYCFDLDALLAAELRTVVAAAVYAEGVQVSETLCYSADTYGNGKTGMLAELCKALFAYSDSARAFFAG